jgi:hypothetical protein
LGAGELEPVVLLALDPEVEPALESELGVPAGVDAELAS